MKLPAVFIGFFLVVFLFAVPKTDRGEPPKKPKPFKPDTAFISSIRSNLALIKKQVDIKQDEKLQKVFATSERAKELEIIAEERLGEIKEMQKELEEVKSVKQETVIVETPAVCDSVAIMNLKRCKLINL